MAYSKQNFQNGQILNAANLEAMENGIIAGQGAENLLDNSNFRDPVNSRGKNTYSDAGNEYTIDRWKTQGGTNISIENGYINIIGQWELYQIIQNPKDGIYTFAARIRINSVGQFTPIIEVNNGSNTGRQINLDADIGEWKTYILQYDLSSMKAETIKFLLSPRGGNTTASISVEWAAMYKGAYTANTLPAYVPKGKHVEMLNCGVSLQPHNLLDNSDFRNPVNSRGITSTEASGYHIDRWKKENESGKVTVGNGYLSMTGTGAYWFLTQYIEPKKIKSGAVYTIALADTSGSISICSTVMSTNMTKFTARHTFTSGAVVITNVEYASDKYSIYFTSHSSKETRFAWAALYEGAYTINTIPPYTSKGKHIEMLNCGIPLTPKNLLVNSDFRYPIDIDNKIGSINVNPCFTRWNIERANSDTTTQIIKIDNGIRIYKNGGIARFYQSCNYNLLGKTVSYAIGTTEGVFVGSCSVSTNSVFTRIGTHTGYLSVYYSSESGKTIFSLYFNDNSEDAIDLYWAALYEGAYTLDTIPMYQSESRHVEMLNCGVQLNPRNLLDNSDFRNPVNQRGQTSWTAHGVYCIDRWKTESANNAANISYTAGSGITLTPSSTNYAGIIQQFENYSSMTGKVYTIAICVNNVWYSGTFTMGATPSGGVVLSNGIRIYSASGYNVLIRNPAGQSAITIQRAALYEGSYTADTLPAYVPVGKHVEMLNCNVPLAPHNLLDNSDFTNPVNQRGQSSYSGTGGKVYTIDRWHTWSASISVSVQSGYLSITNSTDSIYQNISQIIAEHNLTGKAATIAVWDASGNVYCASGIISTNNEITCNTPTDFWFSAILEDDNTIYFAIRPRGAKTAKIKAAALYEGSYDASTLPAYQPKGYAAELAECQRYYYQSWNGSEFNKGYITREAISASSLALIEFPIEMRIVPTITFYTAANETGVVKEWTTNSSVSATQNYTSTKAFGVSGGGNFTIGKTYYFHYSASADL